MTEVVFEAFQTVVLIVGALWAFIKVRTRREHHPWVEFDAEIELYGDHPGQRVAEISLRVENKGLVRQTLQHCAFEFACRKREDQSAEIEAPGTQVSFPHIIAAESWITRDDSYLFTEPGVQRTYTRIYAVPSEATLLRLQSVCLYAPRGRRSTNVGGRLSFDDIQRQIEAKHDLEFDQVSRIRAVTQAEPAQRG